MTQRYDEDKKISQESLESIITDFKEALAQGKFSDKDKEAVNMKIKALEIEFSKWKYNHTLPIKSDDKNAALFVKKIDVHNQFEAGQEREILFLITLLQIDEIWANNEKSKISDNDEKKTAKNQHTSNVLQKNCFCKKVAKILTAFLNSHDENELMDPVTKYLKSKGAIENYEFKLLSINLDESEDLGISTVIHNEITLLNKNINEILQSESPIDKSKMKLIKSDSCKCQGTAHPHNCQLKSKQSNKFNLNSMFCEIVLSRLCDLHNSKNNSDTEEDTNDSSSDQSENSNIPHNNQSKRSSLTSKNQPNNYKIDENKSQINKTSSEYDSNVNVKNSENSSYIELKSITQYSSAPTYSENDENLDEVISENLFNEKVSTGNKSIHNIDDEPIDEKVDSLVNGQHGISKQNKCLLQKIIDICKFGKKSQKSNKYLLINVTDEKEMPNIVMPHEISTYVLHETTIKSEPGVNIKKEQNIGELKNPKKKSLAGLIIMRALSDTLILVKWKIPENNQIVGYEINVDGFVIMAKSGTCGLITIQTKLTDYKSVSWKCIKNESH